MLSFKSQTNKPVTSLPVQKRASTTNDLYEKNFTTLAQKPNNLNECKESITKNIEGYFPSEIVSAIL